MSTSPDPADRFPVMAPEYAQTGDIIDNVDLDLPARFATYMDGTHAVEHRDDQGDPIQNAFLAYWLRAQVRARGVYRLRLSDTAQARDALTMLTEYAETLALDTDPHERKAADTALTRIHQARIDLDRDRADHNAPPIT